MKGRKEIGKKCEVCRKCKCSSNLHLQVMNYCYFNNGKLTLTEGGKKRFGTDCLEVLKINYTL